MKVKKACVATIYLPERVKSEYALSDVPKRLEISCLVSIQGSHRFWSATRQLWTDSRFRVTEFVAGQRWNGEVAGIPATGHRVEPHGPDRCRVVFEVPLLATPSLVVHRIRIILEEEQRSL